MANINEEARIPVYLNDEQARSALKNLQNEADKWRQKMHEAMVGGDMKGMKEAEREMKKAQRAAEGVKKAAFDVNEVLNSLSSASIEKLTKAKSRLRFEMKGLDRDTKEYIALSKQYKAVDNEIKKINGTITQQRSLLDKLKSAAGGLLPAFGFAAIAYGFKRIIGEADSLFLKFEERVDNLSALTGLEGEQLEWLKQKAKETSVATVEGNIRIKQSAEAIVDAYTKVGSKRPELLKSKEALAAVTQEAIILSEAAKSELEPAVAGLTMALNQFDMKAEESRRIINVLAAGSKVGAGDIPYLTQAMEKSGTTANLMKIPIEQWAGAIESVAPYYEQAAMAGNSFDKVLLKMKEKQIGYVNGVFDMNTALDQLEKMYASGKSSAEIFGVEHSKMGELLVKERANMNEYTKAVTGSNVAIEQAAKNTDNNAAKRAQAQNKINILYLEFGEKIAPLVTKGITGGVEIVKAAIVFFAKYGKALTVAAIAVASYTVAVKLAVMWQNRSNTATLAGIVAQKLQALAFNAQFAAISLYNAAIALFTGKIKVAAIQFRAFSAALMANPVGLIISLLTTAATAFYLFSSKADVAKKSQKEFNDEVARGNELLGQSKTLEERASIVKNLSKEQLENLKNDLQAQLKEEENFHATLLQKAKKAVDEDAELNRINELRKQKDLTEIQKINLAAQANARAIAITRELESENKTNQQRLVNLKAHLTKVNTEIGKRPEPTPATDNSGKSSKAPGITTAADVTLVDTSEFDQRAILAQMDAELLAEKKADEKEWTAFLTKQIEERVAAEAQALQIEGEIAQARQDLKDIQINAIGQLASTMAGMFEQGSAAQIAMIAIEKAIAIAQIWMNLAREKSAINLAAAQISTIPVVGPGLAVAYSATMTAKAIVSAKINTGLIAAQTVASAVSSGKRNKKEAYYDGGHTGPGGKYEPAGIVHAGEYVIPSEGTGNPQLRPFIDIMEIARRNGSLARLDLRPIVQMMPGKSYASGGYASSGSSNSAATTQSQPYTNYTIDVDKFDKAITRLENMKLDLNITEVKKRLNRLEDRNKQSKLN